MISHKLRTLASVTTVQRPRWRQRGSQRHKARLHLSTSIASRANLVSLASDVAALATRYHKSPVDRIGSPVNRIDTSNMERLVCDGRVARFCAIQLMHTPHTPP